MNDISDKCKLSQIYTNHFIRVTGATVLTRSNFSSSEIMSITGHKSVQSLTRYQKTQDQQKIAMGHVMHQSLTRQESDITVKDRKELCGKKKAKAIQYGRYNVNVNVGPSNAVTLVTPQNIVQNKENVSAEIIPFESNMEFGDVSDFDLLQMINEVGERENLTQNLTPTTTTNSSAMMSNNVLNNMPKSWFHNCTIQNVTFNMPKWNTLTLSYLWH